MQHQESAKKLLWETTPDISQQCPGRGLTLPPEQNPYFPQQGCTILLSSPVLALRNM